MKYVSANEYAKRVHLSVEVVKDQCRKGELDCFMTDGGHYKIAVREDDSVSIEKYNELLEKYNKLVGVMNFIHNATDCEVK